MHVVNFFYYTGKNFKSKMICASNRAGRTVDPHDLSPTLFVSNMLEHNHQFAKPQVFTFLINMQLTFMKQ